MQCQHKPHCCRLTLTPFASFGVEVIGVETVWLIDPVEEVPDVHDLLPEHRVSRDVA